jgi:hypothetical protein
MSRSRPLRERLLFWYFLRSIPKTQESGRELEAAQERWRTLLSTGGDGRLSSEDIDLLYTFWDISRVEKKLNLKLTPVERAALKTVLIENQSKESHLEFFARTVRGLATFLDMVTSRFFRPLWLPISFFTVCNLIDYSSAYLLFLGAPNIFIHSEGNRALVEAFTTGNLSPILAPVSLAYAAVLASAIFGGKTSRNRLNSRFMPYLRFMAMCVIVFMAIFSLFGALSTLTLFFGYIV